MFILKTLAIKESGNALVVIAQNEQLPQLLPSSIRIVKSLVVANSENLLSRGEIYVIFRKYLGMNPTGSKPWVVTSYAGDHQNIISQHQNLIAAVESAKKVNGMNLDAFHRPESAILTFIRKLLKRAK